MRKIGGELSQSEAVRFVDYMFTQDVSCTAEATDEGADASYDVWVRDEDQLQRARQALAEFRAAPQDPKFDVSQQAAQIRRERQREQRERIKLQQAYQSRGAPAGSAGRFGAPSQRWTIGIIVTCVLATLLTNFGNMDRVRGARTLEELPSTVRIYNTLTLVPRYVPANEPTGGPLTYVGRGQVWRLVTPIFLHASPLHLLFNCLFIFFFGRVIEQIWGARYLVTLFLVAGVVGNLTQAYGPAMLGASANVVGASGGALALFTFLWLRPMVEPSVPIRVPAINVVFILGFVVLGLINRQMMPDVAHLAHLGGMVAGAAAALGMLDFLQR
jgi:GlpG protein